ncbi:MAG: valine--tRNA ligase [Candidatus Aenigmarchaeota archaeon]|nr:valine--tRNA ligase [Candidatus Aenigmarchaeota archaeon]
MPLDKNWTKDFEKQIYEEWKNSGRFAFTDRNKPVFSIDTPPPYVNTPVHVGHAATYSLMDMFARFHRMIDHDVLFPLGLDRNGLPIEMAAEKKFGVSLNEVSREEFIEMCRKVLEESSEESIDSYLKLGISFNSWQLGSGLGDMYFTDSREYRSLTQSTFIELWNRGLIYEDERTNNYCPGCKTTLADAEIDYEDKPSLFNDIIFTVKETGEEVIIATTRPELIASCGMVIFHPDDKKYKHLGGKTAITPLFKKEVPIKAHPFADPEKGTGLMMMCAFGDQTDIRFFREMNLKPVIVINTEGRMNENALFLKGLTVKEAREKILHDLKDAGLLVSQKKIVHRTPICERSKDEIEFIAMSEFYLKQVDLKDEMRKLADQINFFSPKSKQILLDWIESVSIDWPISRRRYYGTEIPLWYCGCGQVIVPPKGYYYQPWREGPPIKQCPSCGSSHFRGEERVFDTWFDSANSPLYILKWQEEDFYRKAEPCTLRPQGKEIVRTWLYYTLLKGFLLTDKPIFRDVWIHHHIVDESGKKMSKSVGNIIDPHNIIDKFGAEPFRLWCALEGNLEKDDMRCSFERIDGAGKTLTKLWNVARFVSQFDINLLLKKEKTGPTVEVEELDAKLLDIELTELDKVILKDLNGIVKQAREQYEQYDFHNPVVSIRHFLWETFASHYLELVKNRAYNQKNIFTEAEQRSALFTIHHCLTILLKLLAPVIPFMTEKIYKDVYNGDIHSEKFPKYEKIEANLTMQDIEELNSIIWKAKKDKSLSLKAEVSELVLPEKFACIEKDIVTTHSVKDISYGTHIEVKV